MKTLRTFTLPLLTLAIASSLAYAQQQPSEDAVNPQNRDPLSSQQGDRTQNTQSSTSQVSSVLNAGGPGMAFEQLARSRADELDDATVIDASGKELGEIEEIVTGTADSALYAVIEKPDDSLAAVRLSELQIAELSYDDSAEDLQKQPYDQSRFEALGPTAVVNATSSQANARPLGQEGAANSNSQTSSASASTPADANQPLVAALALISPAHLEGKKLSGDDDEDLGEIQQIVRSTADGRYYAVVANSQNLNQAVVRLDELEVEKLSFMGDASDLSQPFQRADYQDLR